jgi:hypothetical protein
VYIIAESFEGLQEDLISCSIIPNKWKFGILK